MIRAKQAKAASKFKTLSPKISEERQTDSLCINCDQNLNNGTGKI